MIVQETLFPTDTVTKVDEKGSDSWYTPQHIITKVETVFDGHIDLDPCANAKNTVGAQYYFTEADDCLSCDWSFKDCEEFYIAPPRTIYMNPPYSDSPSFLQRMCEYLWEQPEASAITLTKEGSLFNVGSQDIFKFNAKAICLVRGRLKFWNPVKNESNTPNFDVAFGYWGNGDRLEKFVETFKHLGMIVVPHR